LISQQQQQQQQQQNQQHQQQRQQQQQQQQQTPQQQMQQQQQLNRQMQARLNMQNGNIAQGGTHAGAQAAAFRQIQQAHAAQGQGNGNMVLSPQNIGMMNMNLVAAISQGAAGGLGVPGAPSARMQQALAAQSVSNQPGHNANMGLGSSPHNVDSPSSVAGNNVMEVPAAHMAYARIDVLADEKRAEVFEKVCVMPSLSFLCAHCVSP
jgi:hypothetical protein